MSFFSETAAAVLADRTVRLAPLVLTDFTSQAMRFWLGRGGLDAGGQSWSGLGELGSISGLEIPLGGTAPVTTLGLSGVKPELVAKALDAASEVKGRPAVIYLQFFDSAWQVLDSPYAILSGQMDRMSVSATGPLTRTVEVSVEWLFTRRAIPPYGFLSDRDQRGLYAGDRGLEQMAAMQNKTAVWPAF
jgi:hypothetical protein